MKTIPFIDLKAQYQALREPIQNRIQKVLDHGFFIMGPEVEEVEKLLAQFTGVKHAVACSSGTDAAILTIGHIGNYVAEACEILESQGVNAAHYDLRFVKPLDEAMLHEILKNHSRVITVEDGSIQGGFGSAILEFMADNQYTATVRRLGIPDQVVEHGEQHELYRECHFDAIAMEATALELIDVSVAKTL